jgi:antitoxin PrlF
MSITVTITSRGIISLPAALRKAVGLKPNDHLIAEATGDGILLRPAVTVPIEMYSDARIAQFDAQEAELETVLVRKVGERRGATPTNPKKRAPKRKA